MNNSTRVATTPRRLAILCIILALSAVVSGCGGGGGGSVAPVPSGGVAPASRVLSGALVIPDAAPRIAARAVAGATVTLLLPDGSTKASVTTSAGVFTFSDVPQGTLEVTSQSSNWILGMKVTVTQEAERTEKNITTTTTAAFITSKKLALSGMTVPTPETIENSQLIADLKAKIEYDIVNATPFTETTLLNSQITSDIISNISQGASFSDTSAPDVQFAAPTYGKFFTNITFLTAFAIQFSVAESGSIDAKTFSARMTFDNVERDITSMFTLPAGQNNFTLTANSAALSALANSLMSGGDTVNHTGTISVAMSDISRNRATTTVSFIVTPSGTAISQLAGFVILPDNAARASAKPAAGASVVVHQPTGELLSMNTSADGSFAFRNVFAGTREVIASTSNWSLSMLVDVNDTGATTTKNITTTTTAAYIAARKMVGAGLSQSLPSNPETIESSKLIIPLKNAIETKLSTALTFDTNALIASVEAADIVTRLSRGASFGDTAPPSIGFTSPVSGQQVSDFVFVNHFALGASLLDSGVVDTSSIRASISIDGSEARDITSHLKIPADNTSASLSTDADFNVLLKTLINVNDSVNHTVTITVTAADMTRNSTSQSVSFTVTDSGIIFTPLSGLVQIPNGSGGLVGTPGAVVQLTMQDDSLASTISEETPVPGAFAFAAAPNGVRDIFAKTSKWELAAFATIPTTGSATRNINASSTVAWVTTKKLTASGLASALPSNISDLESAKLVIPFKNQIDAMLTSGQTFTLTSLSNSVQLSDIINRVSRGASFGDTTPPTVAFTTPTAGQQITDFNFLTSFDLRFTITSSSDPIDESAFVVKYILDGVSHNITSYFSFASGSPTNVTLAASPDLLSLLRASIDVNQTQTHSASISVTVGDLSRNVITQTVDFTIIDAGFSVSTLSGTVYIPDSSSGSRGVAGAAVSISYPDGTQSTATTSDIPNIGLFNFSLAPVGMNEAIAKSGAWELAMFVDVPSYGATKNITTKTTAAYVSSKKLSAGGYSASVPSLPETIEASPLITPLRDRIDSYIRAGSPFTLTTLLGTSEAEDILQRISLGASFSDLSAPVISFQAPTAGAQVSDIGFATTFYVRFAVSDASTIDASSFTALINFDGQSYDITHYFTIPVGLSSFTVTSSTSLPLFLRTLFNINENISHTAAITLGIKDLSRNASQSFVSFTVVPSTVAPPQ